MKLLGLVLAVSLVATTLAAAANEQDRPHPMTPLEYSRYPRNQLAELDVRWLEPLEGDQTESGLGRTLRKGIVGAAAAAILAVGVFLVRATMRRAPSVYRKVTQIAVSRRHVAYAGLIVVALIAVYSVLSNHRFTYVRISERLYVQIDNWTGERRSCTARSSGVQCSEWE